MHAYPRISQKLINNIRFTLCQISAETGTPHLASCLSCVELLVSLYWQHMRIDPTQPHLASRDYFLLSKGHAASALYTTLAYRGFFPLDDLFQHGKTGSAFEEHPGKNAPAGVETVSGSLGHALSLACGMALVARQRGSDNHFYVLMGDGELNEGTVWEAAMFAAQHQLNNVTAIIDFNKLQGTGRSREIMHLEPLDKKWQSFGWHTQRVAGHDLNAINSALENTSRRQPNCVVADTVKGKGISFMEDDNNWHYRIPSEDELHTIAEELRAYEKRLCQ